MKNDATTTTTTPAPRLAAQAESTPRQCFFSPRWVWASSDASILKNQKSVLAGLEMVVSFFVVNWITASTPWPLASLFSAMAVPLLLMRSPESVDMGVLVMKKFWNRSDPVPENWQTLLVAVLVTAIAFGILFGFFIPWNYVWPLFDGKNQIILDVPKFLCAMLLVIITAILLLSAYIVLNGNERAVNRVINFSSVFVILLPLLPLVIFTRFLIVRVYCTWHEWKYMVPNFSRNANEALWLTDMLRIPEIMPQASRVSDKFDVKEICKKINPNAHNRFKIPSAFFSFCMLVVIYLSAMIYRMNIKAGAFVWWPLMMAMSNPRELWSVQEARYRISVITKGFWATKRFWLLGFFWLWLFYAFLDAAVLAALQKTDLGNIATMVLSFVSPPPVHSIRFGLLVACWVLTLWLHTRSEDFRAAYGKAAEGAKDFDDHGIKAENMVHLESKMKVIHRLNYASFGCRLVTWWVVLLWAARHFRPDDFPYLIWPWLSRWL